MKEEKKSHTSGLLDFLSLLFGATHFRVDGLFVSHGLAPSTWAIAHGFIIYSPSTDVEMQPGSVSAIHRRAFL